MNPKISIVVPVYNVEAYIAKCLDSLVCQDYDNYDVLVVNDGSPANEQVIIDEYAKRYPSIIKTIVKENGGYGSVLELAFSKSDADYVLVCDSDDSIAPDALSTLNSYREKTGADLVVAAKDLVFADGDDKKYDKSYNEEFGKMEDGKRYIKGEKDFEMLYFMEPSPHAKLYRRDIVKNIVFPHKISYTDNLLYFYTLSKVNTVTYCKKPLAYYLIDRVGNTRTDLKAKVIDDWTKVFLAILEQTENCMDIFYYRLFESFYSIYYKVDQIKGDEKVKEEKYEVLYSFLEKLIPYSAVILKKNDEYQNDSKAIAKQKRALLNEKTSRKMYDSLVKERLYGSFKSRLKNALKNTKLYDLYYSKAIYFKTRNDKKIELADGVTCTAIGSEDCVSFFGYYDKPCVRNGKAITHRLSKDNFDYKQIVEIYVGDKKVSSSSAWNFQQGAMTSWYDDDHIIHNDFDGTKYISRLVDIDTLESKTFDFPIYSLSKDRNFALSLNFSRLAKLRRDYGYFNLPYEKLPENDADGIYYIDLKENRSELYLSLKDIIAFETKDSMKGAEHKVNHIDISPKSDKAIFLHRWFKNGIKYTRLLCMDIKEKTLHLLADHDMVSHLCWYGNDMVFGYLRGNNGKDGYFFIDMDGNQKQLVHELLVDDGHPTLINERYIISDAYPDWTCKSKLLLIDLKENSVKVIGRFYSYEKYQGERRCDLHPRKDHEGEGITIDSVYSGKRNSYHIDLSSFIEK